jgi:hypothetical protein
MRALGRTWLLGLAIASAAALASRAAGANGVFPSAGQIVVDPGDPAHLLVRTTFGILTTRAGGEPWDWICESAVGYGDFFDPAIAVTQDGTVLAGIADGLAVAHGDTCTWTKAPGPIDGHLVVDVSVEKAALSHAVAVTANGAGDGGRFWESLDDGVTWTQAGTNLPADLTVASVDVAPSDATRVYVSGLTKTAVSYEGALAVSPDRGQSWSVFPVPSSDVGHAPYVAAIDPQNPDRVYVRTDGLPGRLFVFDLATATFSEAFTSTGRLYGFAISPDGQTLLVGGNPDGIWRAPSASMSFEKVAGIAPRCLTWVEAGVYMCAADIAEIFTVGLSHDQGATFEPIIHLPCVRGPLDCERATGVGALCGDAWPMVALQIGHETCMSGASSGSAGGATSGMTAATGPAGDGGGNLAGPGTGGVAGHSSSAGGAAPEDPGCACSLAAHASSAGAAGADPAGGGGSFAGLAAALLLLRRRRRRE